MEQFQVIDHCLMVKLPEEVDHHLSQYLCKRADEYLMQKEVNNIIFDFEDTVFMGVKDFDEYLSMLFGKDYMIPKQYSHFSDYSNVVVDQ